MTDNDLDRLLELYEGNDSAEFQSLYTEIEGKIELLPKLEKKFNELFEAFDDKHQELERAKTWGKDVMLKQRDEIAKLKEELEMSEFTATTEAKFADIGQKQITKLKDNYDKLYQEHKRTIDYYENRIAKLKEELEKEKEG